MKYTVLWKPAAQQQLAQLWNEAADRGAVGAAADEIDALLRHDPETRGESRFPPMRILIEPPLAVIFTVKEDDRIVLVSDEWRWRRL
jgi:hypothetical protein